MDHTGTLSIMLFGDVAEDLLSTSVLGLIAMKEDARRLIWDRKIWNRYRLTLVPGSCSSTLPLTLVPDRPAERLVDSVQLRQLRRVQLRS